MVSVCTTVLLPSSTVGVSGACACTACTRWSSGEVQVDSGGFEQMIGHLVHVFYRADDLCTDGSSVVEALQLSPCSAVRAFDKLGFRGVVLIDVVRVDPLLNLDTTGAIVESVRRVCCLCRYVADLANEGKLYIVLAAVVSTVRQT